MACDETRGERLVVPAPSLDGVVLTAPLTSAPAPLPRALRAPPDGGQELPALAAGLWSQAVCLGRHGAREAWAAQEAPRWWWPSDCVIDPLDPRQAGDAGWCTWLEERIAAGNTSNDVLVGLTRCPGGLELLRPWPVGLQWWAVHHPDRLGDALLADLREALLAAEMGGREWSAVVQALSEAEPTVEGGALLLELHRRAGEPALRAEVGRAAWRYADPALRALADQGCAELEAAAAAAPPEVVPPTDPRCDPVLRDPFADLDAFVRARVRSAGALGRLDGLAAAEPTRRAALLEALERCVRDLHHDEPQSALICAASRARLDRAGTLALLEDLPLERGDQQDLRAFLRRFGDAREAIGHLVERGVVGSCEPPAPEPLLVADLIVACGRGLTTSGRGGAALLQAVAALIPTLDGVPVAVLGDAEPGSELDHPRQTMFAWVEDRRQRALLRWPDDLEQEVGFVNALAALTGADLRVAAADGLEHRTVLVGPPAALQALQDDGLVTFLLP